MRTGAEASKLDPANTAGLAWSAIGLKVAHPDRPHRLTLKVKGGEPAALGVALVEPGGARPGSAARLLLDACASGPPILQDGPAATFTWLVWPRAAEMVLVLINRSPEAEVRLGTVSLAELDGLSKDGPAPEARYPTAARMLGLYLSWVARSGTLRRQPGLHGFVDHRPEPGQVSGILRRFGRGASGTTGRSVDSPGTRRPGRRRLDRARSTGNRPPPPGPARAFALARAGFRRATRFAGAASS